MSLIRTVMGDIVPAEMGRSTSHEHLFVDLTAEVFQAPPDPADSRRIDEPVSLHNLGWVRQHWASNKDNLVLDSRTDAIREALDFKQAGGSTIVDATTQGLGPRPDDLLAISELTGLHIVMGTGFYTAASQSSATLGRTRDELVREMVHTIEKEPNSVRAGFVGEVGCTWPIHDFELRSLEASAIVQQETGAVVMVHPGRDARSPLQILEIFARLGDVSRLIMCHMDRTLFHHQDEKQQVAASGCYIAYDNFGLEVSYFPKNPAHPMPSDAQRIDDLKLLIGMGVEDRLLIAHDMCIKSRTKRYGGHGLAHLLKTVNRQMADQGVQQSIIEKILVANPARAFAIG